jgi:hypothetical protein
MKVKSTSHAADYLPSLHPSSVFHSSVVPISQNQVMREQQILPSHHSSSLNSPSAETISDSITITTPSHDLTNIAPHPLPHPKSIYIPRKESWKNKKVDHHHRDVIMADDCHFPRHRTRL